MLRSTMTFSHLLSKGIINHYEPTVTGNTLTFSTAEDTRVDSDKINKLLRDHQITTIVYDIDSTTNYLSILKSYLKYVQKLEIKKYSSTELDLSNYGCEYLTSITIPDSITTISSGCFQSFAITSIDLKNVKTIRSNAFSSCYKLEKIVASHVTSISSSFAKNCYSLSSITTGVLTSIGSSAFYNCHKLKSIEIGSVTEIGSEAFYRAGIKSVTIPSSCTRIESSAFEESALESISFSERTEDLVISNEVFAKTYITSVTIPKQVTLGSSIFDSCGKLEKINIDESITTIPAGFAHMCISLKSVVAKGITSVSTSAFELCINLQSATLGSVTTFNSKCFMYCTNLSMSFNESLEITFSDSCFAFCDNIKLTNVPKEWTINNNAFLGCGGISTLKINATLSQSSFKGCRELTSVELLENVETVPSSCFGNCSALTSLKFTKNLKNINSYAFSFTGLTGSYNFSSIELSSNAFDSTQIEDVIIGKTDYHTFFNCTNLKTVKIDTDGFTPQSFINCSEFDIKLEENAERLKFDNNILYYYYKSTTSDFTEKKLLAVLPNYESKSMTISEYDSINAYAFSLSDRPRELIIDGLMITLKANTIKESNIRRLEIKNFNGVNIPSSAFQDAYNLQEVIIAEGIVAIDSLAFSDCYRLKSIELSSTLRSIGPKAFWNCYNLKYIDLSNVDIILAGAFLKCESLYSVTFSNKLTSINNQAFRNTYIKNLVIPASVLVISDSAFSYCNNLKRIEYESGILEIGSIGSNCPNLKKIIIPDTVRFITSNAFNGYPNLDVEIDSSNPYFEAQDHAIIEKSTQNVIASYGTLPKVYEVPEGVINVESLSRNQPVENIQSGSVSTGISAAIVKYPSSNKGSTDFAINSCSDSYADQLSNEIQSNGDCSKKLPDYYYWRFHRGMTPAEIALTVILVLIAVAAIVLVIIYFTLIKKKKVEADQEP